MAVNPEDIEQARRQGQEDAAELVEHKAPADPVLRIAWAHGLGDSDHVRDAVARAREAGVRWQDIADALGLSIHTAKFRFGATGYERQRRYRERKRQQGDEG